MPKLVINSQDIELGSAKIALTKIAYNFFSFGSRSLTYSKALSIPRTAINDSIFNRPSDLSVKDDRYGVFYDFVYSDFSQILFSGKAILIDADNAGYSLQLIDGSMSFFDALNNDLNQLSGIDSDDFTFSLSSYNTLKQVSSGLWQWSTNCNHENRKAANTSIAGDTASLKYSRPFFRLRWLVDKMFTDNDWSYTGRLQAEIYDKGINSNSSDFFVCSYQKTVTDSYSIAGTQSINGIDTNDFEYNVNTSSTVVDVKTIKTRFRIRGNITCTNDFELIVKGSSTTLVNQQFQTFQIRSGTHYYDITTNDFETAEAANNINFEMSGTSDITFNGTLIYTQISEEDTGDLSTNPLLNYRVKGYDNLPDFTQLQLLKDVLNLTGQFFTTNNANKELTFSRYSDINKLNSVDWSDKADISDFKVSGTSGTYGQTTYFSYNNDDTIPTNVGRGQILVSDLTLPDIQTAYTSIFSASNEVVISSLTLADFNVYDDTSRINDINTRICTLTDNSTYSIANFQNLKYNEIINAKFGLLVRESIKEQELLNIHVNLSRSDFFSLDFVHTVYIEHFRSSFLIVEVNDYIDNELTEVVLMKAQ